VKPHQQVVQICHKLETRRKSLRVRGHCSGCGETRLVNKPLVVEVQPTDTPRPDETLAGAGEPVACLDLDNFRRFLIQRLRALDPPQEREGFSSRVNRLRDRGILPKNISSLMLTHSTFRNLTYYEDYKCTRTEVQLLQLIERALRDYFRRECRVDLFHVELTFPMRSNEYFFAALCAASSGTLSAVRLIQADGPERPPKRSVARRASVPAAPRGVAPGHLPSQSPVQTCRLQSRMFYKKSLVTRVSY
jgi:hypothetical protein